MIVCAVAPPRRPCSRRRTAPSRRPRCFRRRRTAVGGRSSPRSTGSPRRPASGTGRVPGGRFADRVEGIGSVHRSWGAARPGKCSRVFRDEFPDCPARCWPPPIRAGRETWRVSLTWTVVVGLLLCLPSVYPCVCWERNSVAERVERSNLFQTPCYRVSGAQRWHSVAYWRERMSKYGPSSRNEPLACWSRGGARWRIGQTTADSCVGAWTRDLQRRPERRGSYHVGRRRWAPDETRFRATVARLVPRAVAGITSGIAGLQSCLDDSVAGAVSFARDRFASDSRAFRRVCRVWGRSPDRRSASGWTAVVASCGMGRVEAMFPA